MLNSLFSGVLMRFRGESVGFFAVLGSRGRLLPGFVRIALVVLVGGLMVVVFGCRMMGRREHVVVGCRMWGR